MHVSKARREVNNLRTSLEASRNAGSSAATIAQIEGLLARIDMLDAQLDGHSQKIDAMAAGSPKRHAFGFEEVIAEMRARLRELRGKCGGISASALPLFQIKCVEEEMVSIERDVAGLPREMEATFARRMSFQVSLAAVATSTERVLAFRDRKALR